jgi:glycosyltransferase involved in cell wall biosynthesis
MMKHVLIAHQSTVPHYRVAFYEAVNRLKPPWWDFGVVFDENPGRREKIFVEPVDPGQFGFKTIPTRTVFLDPFGHRVWFQTFIRHAGRFDLIVVLDALHNLSYPLTRLWQMRGNALAYWGHGKDQSVDRAAGWKRLAEKLKRHMVRNCDGYFAYTRGVGDAVADLGVEPSKIHVLNNTIDIAAERSAYESLINQRLELRQAAGFANRRILLLVGRLNKRKRFRFLVEAVQDIRRTRPEYHLVVIGGGDQSVTEGLRRTLGDDGVTCCGTIVERPRLAEWFVRSDVYVNPGNVGLGVVHSLCYDLTPVVIDRRTHSPEYEYLNDRNSVIVRETVSPAEYGSEISALCSNQARWEQYRALAWPSINHLTIDNMAQNFIDGVGEILRTADSKPRP